LRKLCIFKCSIQTQLTMTLNKRIQRDFNKRDDSEKEWFIENTWCDHCLQADLGISNPVEYEIEGKIFIEGNCLKCGKIVISEITE
jgi:hypothetical protein